VGIAILTPSRERPHECREMVAAIADTATGPVAVYIGVDDDDPSDYGPEGVRLWGGADVTVKTRRGPRAQLAEWTNRLALDALDDNFSILGSFGDDHRPRTVGWDLAVRAAFEERGKGLVYTRDGLQDERLPTAPFWSVEIIRALGYFFPPYCKHLWADNWWRAFADALGRRHYLDDVLIEHLHPDAPNGHTYDAINAGNDEHEREDRNGFYAFMDSQEYRDALDRVRAVL